MLMVASSVPPGPSEIATAGRWAGHDPECVQAALCRFASYCEFDPVTGCVIWTGGKTSGRGHSALYGSFWFDGKRWFAHRWAAQFIHGLNIDGLQVDHDCPHIDHPNTLCVQHLQGLTLEQNRLLQTLRPKAVDQPLETRRYWLYVQVGIEPPPPVHEPEEDGIPFHTPPAWLAPFLITDHNEECPF